MKSSKNIITCKDQKVYCENYTAIQIAPTRGMHPHITPQMSPIICLLQYNLSNNSSCHKHASLFSPNIPSNRYCTEKNHLVTLYARPYNFVPKLIFIPISPNFQFEKKLAINPTNSSFHK